MKKYAILLIILAAIIGLAILCYIPSTSTNKFYLRSCQTGKLVGPLPLKHGYLLPQLDEKNYLVADPTNSELKVRGCLLQTILFKSKSEYFDCELAWVLRDINLMLKNRLGDKAPPVRIEFAEKSKMPLITMSMGGKPTYDVLCNIAAKAQLRIFVENGEIVLSSKKYKEIRRVGFSPPN